MKKILVYLVMLLGILSTVWGIYALLTTSFEWGGRYTPEGRDSGIVIFAIIVGLVAIAWGRYEVKNVDNKD